MEVRYADRKVEKICTNEHRMKRTLGAAIAKRLQLRIIELCNVESFADLLYRALGATDRRPLRTVVRPA